MEQAQSRYKNAGHCPVQKSYQDRMYLKYFKASFVCWCPLYMYCVIINVYLTIDAFATY